MYEFSRFRRSQSTTVLPAPKSGCLWGWLLVEVWGEESQRPGPCASLPLPPRTLSSALKAPRGPQHHRPTPISQDHLPSPGSADQQPILFTTWLSCPRALELEAASGPTTGGALSTIQRNAKEQTKVGKDSVPKTPASSLGARRGFGDRPACKRKLKCRQSMRGWWEMLQAQQVSRSWGSVGSVHWQEG